MVLARSARILPFEIERELGMRDVVAAVRVGEKGLRTIRRPFHRPADFARGPQADDLFRVDENLGTEAAADVRRDHAQFVLRRHADESGDDQPRHVRVLRGVPERQVIVADVVFGERHARLDCIRHETIVDDVEPGDVLGGGERRIDCFLVAEVPLVDRVLGNVGVDLRRALRLRLGRIDHRRAAPRNRLSPFRRHRGPRPGSPRSQRRRHRPRG